MDNYSIFEEDLEKTMEIDFNISDVDIDEDNIDIIDMLENTMEIDLSDTVEEVNIDE